MFIYNLKLDKKILSKIFIFVSIIIVFSIITFSFYIIFSKSFENNSIDNKGSNKTKQNIIELNESNYADVLKDSNENIDTYVGKKIKITGYVYRLLDFKENQFVIARDMELKEHNQAIIIGFLCEYDKASDYPDGTWLEITGEIIKGQFNGDIAILKVISVHETYCPKKILVEPPHQKNDI